MALYCAAKTAAFVGAVGVWRRESAAGAGARREVEATLLTVTPASLYGARHAP
ncbi:MAG: hypothetical protein AB1648_03350 [Pseudomonadota bacterium]